MLFYPVDDLLQKGHNQIQNYCRSGEGLKEYRSEICTEALYRQYQLSKDQTLLLAYVSVKTPEIISSLIFRLTQFPGFTEGQRYLFY